MGGTRLQKRQEAFVEKLLDWYNLNRRPFCWRNQALRPYEVLVLEILLQRTSAERVNEVFPQFIKRYPNPHALYSCFEEHLESDIRTLGLQRRRARMLKNLAEQLVEKWNGTVPERVEELTQLPGVGIYVANAVLCFSHKRAVPLVDTNVARVLARVFRIPASKDPSSDENTWNFAQSMLPEAGVGEYNWALIDFASLICRPRNPLCSGCPVADICLSAQKLA